MTRIAVNRDQNCAEFTPPDAPRGPHPPAAAAGGAHRGRGGRRGLRLDGFASGSADDAGHAAQEVTHRPPLAHPAPRASPRWSSRHARVSLLARRAGLWFEPHMICPLPRGSPHLSTVTRAHVPYVGGRTWVASTTSPSRSCRWPVCAGRRRGRACRSCTRRVAPSTSTARAPPPR